MGRVLLLLFGSGFSALVYQTAWQRLFQLTFGASTAASAAVLAIFLGGLGLGGVLFGRRVERAQNPLMVYAHLEIGIALFAALTPFLRSGAHHLYLALGGSQALGMVGATVVRLLLAALVIGPAAVLMGGTLPAVARAAVAEGDASRRRLALLYALNTVGAVAGALAGPLILFGVLGTELTLWTAVCVNLLVGILARVLARSAPAVPVGASSAQDLAESKTSSVGPSDGAVTWAYFAAAATGFAFLSLELVWFRVLSPLLGGSSLTFGLILASALFGIGVGGYAYSLRPAERPVTIGLVSTTLAAEALCVLVPFAWGDDVALVAAHLRDMGNLGFGYLLGGWILIALIVVFPASVVSGYQFPALFALLGRGRAGIGRHVGQAYACNTLGTLTGSLLTGFVLLPTVGAVGAWRSMAVILALLALGGAGIAWYSSRRVLFVATPVLTAVAALLLALSPGPGVVFRHSPVGAGRLEIAVLAPNEVKGWNRQTEDTIAWERDGVESSVAINVLDGIAFIVNGKSDGAVVGDRATQTFLGLLPAALHPNAKSAFVVGLGTGVTAGLLARAPGIELVDVAELEPSTVEVSARSALANGNVLENPRARLFFGDGREFLLTSRRNYDLIINEPSNPYRAGVAALFTREYYEASAARLAPNGIFAQWMQGYEIDGRTLAMVLRTLRSVFAHVSIWSPGGGDFVLIGTRLPQTVDVERLRGVVAHPFYLEWMRRAWSMEGAEALVAHHIASPRIVEALTERIPTSVNTDDLNLLEVSFGRTLGDDSYSALRDLFRTLDVAARRPNVRGAIDWALVDDQRHRIGWRGYVGPKATARTQATAVGCSGSVMSAREVWPTGAEPSDIVEIWVVATMEAISGSESALGRADVLEKAGFVGEALLVRSRFAEARGDAGAAVRLLVQAFDGLRSKALPLCDATARALSRAKSLAAAHPANAPELLRAVSKAPFAIHEKEQLRRRTREAIGAKTKDPAVCKEAFASRHGRTTWELVSLAARVRCLEAARSPELALAEAELSNFLAAEPESFSSGDAPAGEQAQGKND